MDGTMKLAFGLIFLGLVLAVRGVALNLRARPEGKINQMAHEVPALRIIRPALGLVFYLALLDWLVPGTRLAWAQFATPSILRWGGVVACVLALLLARASFVALGRNYRGGVGLWRDHELITSGPYARIQHPIYSAFVLFMLGIWALSTSWLVGASGLLLTLSIPALRLGLEERELRARFGDRYARYHRSTPRFVPRSSRGLSD